MSFTLTKQDLKKSALCPPGMKLFTLVEVEPQYVSKKGTSTQKCDFESDEGYVVPTWFNAAVLNNLFEFIAAADHITFDMEKMETISVKLEDYKGKRVAGSVSHRKTDDGKIVAQIDNFYDADKVPF